MKRRLDYLTQLKIAIAEKFPNQSFEPLDTKIEYYQSKSKPSASALEKIKKDLIKPDFR
jgi:hypothetical protein